MPIFLLAFAIITWGYSWVLMKQSLDYMHPFTFVTLRNLTGALFLLPLIIMDSGFKISNFKNPNYIIIGTFQTAAMFALIIYGMKFVTAGKTSVILYAMPIFTAIFLHFILKEKLSFNKWIAVFLGLLGVFFILGWDTIKNQNKNILFGEILIILAAISWAIANIWNKKFLKNSDPSIVNGYQLIIGSLLLVLLTFISKGSFTVDWNYHSVFIVLFTGIVASAVNFSIWFYLINKIDVNTTTFSSLLVPVFGLLFDRMILGTHLDLGIIIGAFLIIFSIYEVSKP